MEVLEEPGSLGIEQHNGEIFVADDAETATPLPSTGPRSA
jgi:hypothetical protein